MAKRSLKRRVQELNLDQDHQEIEMSIFKKKCTPQSTQESILHYFGAPGCMGSSKGGLSERRSAPEVIVIDDSPALSPKISIKHLKQNCPSVYTVSDDSSSCSPNDENCPPNIPSTSRQRSQTGPRPTRPRISPAVEEDEDYFYVAEDDDAASGENIDDEEPGVEVEVSDDTSESSGEEVVEGAQAAYSDHCDSSPEGSPEAAEAWHSPSSSAYSPKYVPPSTYTAFLRDHMPLLPRGGYNSPLPLLTWVDKDEAWDNMIATETEFFRRRDPDWTQRHPGMMPHMRGILVEWMCEVSEVYKLHRRTYHLAVEYLDRYMSATQEVCKNSLQLIGITCLFIAAKFEEIYPPKLAEFAYVTDKACSMEDIQCQEVLVLQALAHRMNSMTSLDWLQLFLQVINMDCPANEDIHNSFVTIQYSPEVFVNIVRLLDLCLLDVSSLQFNYCQLAAAAVCHHTNRPLMEASTRFEWKNIEECFNWMVSRALILRDDGVVSVVGRNGIAVEDYHNIQAKNVSLELVERAREMEVLVYESARRSPESGNLVFDPMFFTPPLSGGSDKASGSRQHRNDP